MTSVLFETFPTIELTPVQPTPGGYWLKRDDTAHYTTPDMPSGAKIRQYLRMSENAASAAVFAQGCHACSAMQVYVSAMGEMTGRQAYIAIPARKHETASTAWAERHGAIMQRVTPPYPSVYYHRALQMAAGRPIIRWNDQIAVLDTAAQVANLPSAAKRVIVPTVSGLTVAGVIGGLAARDRLDVEIVAVCVAQKQTQKAVELLVRYHFAVPPETYRATFHAPYMRYDKPLLPNIVNGVWVDPYYEAKAIRYIQPRDVFWIVGRRPVAAVDYDDHNESSRA